MPDPGVGCYTECDGCNRDREAKQRFNISGPLAFAPVPTFQWFEANIEVLRLCPNGDIFINGKLATTDLDVVEGFRELLCGRPVAAETEARKLSEELSLARAKEVVTGWRVEKLVAANARLTEERDEAREIVRDAFQNDQFPSRVFDLLDEWDAEAKR